MPLVPTAYTDNNGRPVYLNTATGGYTVDFPTAGAQGPVSTGQVELQTNPTQTPGTVTSASVADTATDTGTDAPVRTLQQTQGTPGLNLNPPTPPDYSIYTGALPGSCAATNPQSVAGVSDNYSIFTGQAPSAPGQGSPTDDSGTVTTSTINNSINQTGSTGVVPQDNILDQLASYTYSLSWYCLTPDQYKTLKNTSKLTASQWSLLVQSGGATNQTNSVGVTNNGLTDVTAISSVPGRNKYFYLDYYLDNFIVDSQFMQNGMMNACTLSFEITEPNGITLLSNLNRAIRDLYQNPLGSVTNALFVMVVKFYGYDAQGNLITNLGLPGSVNSKIPNSTNYVAVKYFPFNVTEFNFSSANKATIYSIKGTMPDYNYAKGSATASIPYNFELTGTTVNDVLNGKINNSVPVSPDDSLRPVTPTPQTAPTLPTPTGNPGYNPYNDAGY